MMTDDLQIRTACPSDIPALVALRGGHSGNVPLTEYFTRCLKENEDGRRITFAAVCRGETVGYVNLIYQSLYPSFLARGIPEINDLFVKESFRRRGAGKALLTACEKAAAEFSDRIGLGVGLYKDYGAAQRLYAEMGYIPDGRGLISHGREVTPGKDVFVDDDLLLYLCKELRPANVG